MSHDDDMTHILSSVIVLMIIVITLPIILGTISTIKSNNGTGGTPILGGNQVTATVVTTKNGPGLPVNTIVVQYNYNGINHYANIGGITDNPSYNQQVCITVDGSGKYQSLVKETAC